MVCGNRVGHSRRSRPASRSPFWTCVWKSNFGRPTPSTRCISVSNSLSPPVDFHTVLDEGQLERVELIVAALPRGRALKVLSLSQGCYALLGLRLCCNAPVGGLGRAR